MQFVSTHTYRFGWLLLLFGVAGGCTWQEVAHIAGQGAQQVRYQDQVFVQLESAWRIPDDAALELATAASAAPRFWTDAAQRGLDRARPLNTEGRGIRTVYRVWVEWPRPDEDARSALKERSLKLGLLGVTQVPEIAETARLYVAIHDTRGGLVTHGQLRLRPRWWGEDWSGAEQLEAAFFKLAASVSR